VPAIQREAIVQPRRTVSARRIAARNIGRRRPLCTGYDLTLAHSGTTLAAVRAPAILALLPFGLLVACSSGASTPAASSSSLQAQAVALANPVLKVAMSEQMYEAQILCTTALNYRPCGLVAATDTVNCFMLCQAQIAAGATNLFTRGVMACVAQPLEPGDAGSPSCDFVISDESPVDAVQLRANCNTRCRELLSDGGSPAVTAVTVASP
jgi:hypothetical protein